MKPVYQEIVDAGSGDCFSACLASLLEVPLSKVPKFRMIYGDDMMSAARRWAAREFGLGIVTIQMENMDDDDFTGADLRLIGGTHKTPCIAGGISPNLPGCYHAVVGEIDEQGLNFVITHDPNPSRKGIVGHPTHLYFLIPLDFHAGDRDSKQ